MKTIIAVLIILVALASNASAQYNQFSVSKMGNTTVVQDSRSGQIYYFTPPANQGNIELKPIPGILPNTNSKGPDLFPNVPADKKWMYED